MNSAKRPTVGLDGIDHHRPAIRRRRHVGLVRQGPGKAASVLAASAGVSFGPLQMICAARRSEIISPPLEPAA
jgi:hypothetical protein